MKEKIKDFISSFWPIFFVVIVIAISIIGCSIENKTEGKIDNAINVEREDRVKSHIYTITYEGHDYLIYEDAHVVGLTHSGSCRACKKGNYNGSY